MGGYTKLNLKDDVEDQAPKFGPWSSTSSRRFTFVYPAISHLLSSTGGC